VPVSEPVPTVPVKTKPFFKEISFLTGFAEGDLADKDHYQIAPLMMRFGIDLKPSVEHSSPKDLFEFEIEPFASFVASPDTNAEGGINLLVKYGRFVTEKICLYIEGGTGFIYLSQHTREQGTQFNFADYAGGGAHYFIKDNLAVNIGYRFRHISNCSIDSPNKGIDSNMLIAGISWFY
jgi:opacity protein-like surface antigen